MKCSNRDCRAQLHAYEPHWRISADLSSDGVVHTYVYCKKCFDAAHSGDIQFDNSVPQADEAVVPLDGCLVIP